MISSATTKLNCGTFCQSSAQQQVRLDLTGSLRLAGDGLRCLTRCNTNANTAANTGQRCKCQRPELPKPLIIISFVITVLNVLFIPRRRCSLS